LIPNNPFLRSAQTLRGIDRFDARKLTDASLKSSPPLSHPHRLIGHVRQTNQHKTAMSIPPRFVLENHKSQEVTTTWRRSVMVNCPTTFRLY
jgi:hypothetical protein